MQQTDGKKIHFRENWLIFLGIWGEGELSLGISGAKANNFREKRKLFSGSWGDQCIIFRDLGSTYPPPWGASVIIATLNASTGKLLTVTTQHKHTSRDIKNS